MSRCRNTLAGLACLALLIVPAAASAAAHQPRHRLRHEQPHVPVTMGSPDLGPNVIVFNPSMSQASIQSELNTIASQQVPNQFGAQRYSIFFEPGTYGSASDPLVFQVGFYTQVAGLGAEPGDVVINGVADVFNQCVNGDCEGTDNFWRSLSNLTINVTTESTTSGPPTITPDPGDGGGPYCENSAEIWAVSQADPMRSVIINGNLVLQDYCGTGDVSGGFMANDEVSGALDFYGQQQFFVRNSDIGSSSNYVWNQVFMGDNGAPPTDFGVSGGQYTNVAQSSESQEEPYLYTDSGNMRVFVPALQHDSVGPSYASGSQAGSSLPISRFFVATPSTSVREINAALAVGRDLILTPGVYDLSSPIQVQNPNTIVLGLGFATLVPTKRQRRDADGQRSGDQAVRLDL